MPCSSDYLNPSDRERELRHAAKLLVYVHMALNEPVSPNLKAAAADLYCSEDYVPALCARLNVLKKFNPTIFDKLVWDAKSESGRALAAWWDAHQKADLARERQEKQEKERNQLREQALAKLTPAEREALGV